MDADQVETPPVVDGEVVAASEKTAEQTAQAKFLLDFLNKEAAEKGFKDMQAGRTRAEQKAAQLERELAKAQAEKELASVMKELVANRTAQTGESAATARKALKDQLNAEIQSEDPASAILHAGDVWHGQLKGEMDSSISALKQLIEKQQAELNELKETSDGFYQQNKERINEMATKYEIGRSKATQLLRDLVANSTVEDPPRMKGSLSSGASASSASSGKDKAKTRALGEAEMADLSRWAPGVDLTATK